MGGCASKPKGMDLHPPTTPTDELPTPKPEPETVAPIAVETAPPLVDLSDSNEPKQELPKPTEPEKSAETKPEEVAEILTTITPAELTKEEKNEAVAKESEEKKSIINEAKDANPKSSDAAEAVKLEAIPMISEDKSVNIAAVPVVAAA